MRFHVPRFSLRLLIATAAVCLTSFLSTKASNVAFAQDAERPLVATGQVRLNLPGAELAVKAAREKAAEMKIRVNIAVVDDGGHLLAFARMDGARPASGYTAITKAVAAATMRTATGPVPPGTESPDVILNLSLQNAAAASGGKMTTLFGGVPIVVNDQIIGALGVGGARGEQDAEVARAGIKALTDALGASGETSK